MNYINYLPLVILLAFFLLFAIFAKRIDREKRKLIAAFVAGYLLHALLISIVN